MNNRIYGIDLGTTYSAAGLEDKLITNLVPSITRIDLNTAGNSLREDYIADRSFKVNISQGVEGKKALISSSLVLQELVRIGKTAGHDIKKVVISVPAYFSNNQRAATIEAAKRIGLEVAALVNEPTAAAMKYSETVNCLCVIFDLGGGTFDISVIDSRTGVYDVVATSGCIVGGDNLDKEILVQMMRKYKAATHRIPPAEMAYLKQLCTNMKEKIQTEQKSVSSDEIKLSDSRALSVENFVLTVPEYIECINKAFSKCIVLTKQIIEKYIPSYETYKLVLVGGSTQCPYLAEMIESELGVESEAKMYNPNTIVALGACHYAHLMETGQIQSKLSDITKPLGVAKEDGTLEVIIPEGSKIPIIENKLFTNSKPAKGLELEIYQGNSIIAKNNEFIGLLKMDFDSDKDSYESQVIVSLEVNTSGVVEVTAQEGLSDPVSIKLIIGE